MSISIFRWKSIRLHGSQPRIGRKHETPKKVCALVEHLSKSLLLFTKHAGTYANRSFESGTLVNGIAGEWKKISGQAVLSIV